MPGDGPRHDTFKLVVEFRTIEQLAEWVEQLRDVGMCPPDADAHMADNLDMMRPDPRTYILKRNRDRIPGTSLTDVLARLEENRAAAAAKVKPRSRIAGGTPAPERENEQDVYN